MSNNITLFNKYLSCYITNDHRTTAYEITGSTSRLCCAISKRAGLWPTCIRWKNPTLADVTRLGLRALKNSLKKFVYPLRINSKSVYILIIVQLFL